LILRSTPSSQRILFTHGHGKERIESQKTMIIEILVASGQPEQTLGHQFANGVFDQERVAQIAKAPGQGARNPQTLIDLTQQEQALSLLGCLAEKSLRTWREPRELKSRG
jgi:hypothetical protein